MNNIRIALVFLSLSVAGGAYADATTDFNALLGEHWEWTLAKSPVMASTMGDRRYNQDWGDNSLAAIEQEHRETREFLRRVYAIDRTALSEEDQLNYELFRRQLQDTVDEHQFKPYLLPFDHQRGIQSLDTMTNRLRLETVQDFDDWLVRLGKIGDVINQTIALAEAGRKDGIVSPAILVIEKEVLPAYRKLDKYFNKKYLPAARGSIGLSDLPNGNAWYEHQARSYTTTRLTPDEIHRIGLDEVKRIRDEMQKIIAEVEFEGSFQEFLTFLRTDPQFYFDNPDDLYQEYLATSKRLDPELVNLFGKLPRMPYGVKPIPDSIAPDTTTAYYNRPAADGSRAGTYYVNLYKPEVRPKYEIEVLSVHEAVPGHHLQIALQQELGDTPMFRRFMGFTAFVEGWGLYSERLGYDMGLYQDPYSRFGQLTYDMWRAVRLVVDTGMHYKGWTRQQAIDFFKDNAAKTEHDIVNEIDRYIAWPGQALAYKIGQLKILQIRSRAEVQLGENFDIRAFHDELLGAGALPLDLLEQRMDRWMAAH
jgi:prolyl oligopeptidase